MYYEKGSHRPFDCYYQGKARLIGTSDGLAHGNISEGGFGIGTEQLYVVELDDPRRPIEVEFWEGYNIPNRALLTRGQALGMAHALIDWGSLSPLSKGRLLWRFIGEGRGPAEGILPLEGDRHAHHRYQEAIDTLSICEQVEGRRPIQVDFHKDGKVLYRAILNRNQAIEMSLILLRWGTEL